MNDGPETFNGVVEPATEFLSVESEMVNELKCWRWTKFHSHAINGQLIELKGQDLLPP